MIMYEQDPDVLRWGLHLLHGSDPYPNSGYCGTTTQNDTCFYDRDYAREGNFGTGHTTVENDETIAHALQEEFSQLAIAEASGLSHENEEHVQTSILTQDWYGSTMRNFVSGNEGEQEDADDIGSSSCSSPEKLYEGEEYLLELADDFSTLDEVGKRLNQVTPTPHKPRINREIPSADEAISDHQRLLERLQLYELVERKVQGDGNCQFRALSDQFYRTPEHHKFVRQQVINQLTYHREIYEGYVPMAYDEYLKKMSSTGEWGDHVTLQAAADSALFGIIKHNPRSSVPCLMVQWTSGVRGPGAPRVQTLGAGVFLCFLDLGCHYGSPLKKNQESLGSASLLTSTCPTTAANILDDILEANL